MDKKQLKLVGYLVGILLLANMLLFAFRVISGMVFWIIIVVGYLFVKFGLPKLK